MGAWDITSSLAVSSLAPKYGCVRSAVTIPGLDPKIASLSNIRAVFARVIAASFLHIEPKYVRIVRVLELSRNADVWTLSGDRHLSEEVRHSLNEKKTAAKIEFEVEPPSEKMAYLDQIEARLILLSNGGRVAAKFDLALTRNLVAAGVRLPQTSVALRFWVSEPQQLGPKLFANNVVSMPGGRKLEG